MSEDVTQDRMSPKERFALHVIEEAIAQIAENLNVHPVTLIALLGNMIGGMAARFDDAMQHDIDMQALIFQPGVTPEQLKGDELLRTIRLNIDWAYKRSMEHAAKEREALAKDADAKLNDVLKGEK